jgi:hypothetical protein
MLSNILFTTAMTKVGTGEIVGRQNISYLRSEIRPCTNFFQFSSSRFAITSVCRLLGSAAKQPRPAHWSTTMSKSLLTSLIATFAFFATAVSPAAASSITFTFDCDITGPACSPTAPVGTLQLSDSVTNTNWVDVLLTLGSGDPQQFYINYNGFPLPTGYTFAATGTSVDISENTAQADGYTLGFFDLVIPDTGNISGNPFATTLKLTNNIDFANLDALDFADLSTNGALYSAVLKTAGSSWFGATTCDGCSTTPIPEPATMTLFGLGLLGSTFAARRRRRGSLR